MRAPVVILTGDKLRHRMFALHLLRAFDDAVLVTERQHPAAWGEHIGNPSPLAQNHFRAFLETEHRLFAEEIIQHEALLRSRQVLELEPGAINAPDTIRRIAGWQPRALLCLSTSLLKEPFLAAFPGIIANFHAGLSPYYRGSGTNIFPIINREPEYVGVTIHYMDAGIDSGPIIVQGRPCFSPDDDSHTLGCKTLLVGAALMRQVGERLLVGAPPRGIPQCAANGKLYLKKDFTDEVIEQLRLRIEEGVIRRYATSGPKAVIMAESLS